MHPHERLRETASSVPDADNLWAAGGKWRRAVRPASTKVMEPKHSCGFAALYALTFFFFVVFFPPPTVSVLPQQHITAYYACKFRTSKVVIFPVCLSVKPFALICCCVEYDLNIKTLYLDITL